MVYNWKVWGGNSAHSVNGESLKGVLSRVVGLVRAVFRDEYYGINSKDGGKGKQILQGKGGVIKPFSMQLGKK